MYFVIGLAVSVLMAILEIAAVTDIGLLWSLVPAGVGAAAQIGLIGLILEFASFFGD